MSAMKGTNGIRTIAATDGTCGYTVSHLASPGLVGAGLLGAGLMGRPAVGSCGRRYSTYLTPRLALLIVGRGLGLRLGLRLGLGVGGILGVVGG